MSVNKIINTILCIIRLKQNNNNRRRITNGKVCCICCCCSGHTASKNDGDRALAEGMNLINYIRESVRSFPSPAYLIQMRTRARNANRSGNHDRLLLIPLMANKTCFRKMYNKQKKGCILVVDHSNKNRSVVSCGRIRHIGLWSTGHTQTHTHIRTTTTHRLLQKCIRINIS